MIILFLFVVSPDVIISNPTGADVVDGHVNVTCTSQGNPTPMVAMHCDNDLNTVAYPNSITDGTFGGSLTTVIGTLKVAVANADGLKKCYCTASAFDGNQIETRNGSIFLLASE